MDSLYRIIPHNFKNLELLKLALTHRSFLETEKGRWTSNERLELLGDAVLGLIVTEELYRRFPKSSEGELTRAKSYLVSRVRLAKLARKIELGRFIILGTGEERSGGRDRSSILSDTYEALLGAIYLDGGLQAVRSVVILHLMQNVKKLFHKKFHQNYKSWLLEYYQDKGANKPLYHVVKETGPDHKKEFTVMVHVNGKRLGIGRGYNKKSAEQNAAYHAICRLGLNGVK